MSDLYYPSHLRLAKQVLEAARSASVKLVTAESCTGGLIAGLLTEIPGSSGVFSRGFVTYSNAAKQDMLGVAPELIARVGAVSAEVAGAMAEGALENDPDRTAVAVTGVAGPGGGTPTKPVGLVWFATARQGAETRTQVRRFGDIGRSAVRLDSVEVALMLLLEQLSPSTDI